MARRAQHVLRLSLHQAVAIRHWQGATPAHVEAAITRVARGAVTTIRAAARSASAEQFTAHTGAVAGAEDEAAAALDVERAEAAATGLAESWRGSYETAIDDGAEMAAAHESSMVDLVTTYADRTASTEAAHAYNEETVRQAAMAAEHGVGIVLVWSSMLDKGTCDHCASMHGNEIEPGDEVPPVHPNCLCTLVPS